MEATGLLMLKLHDACSELCRTRVTCSGRGLRCLGSDVRMCRDRGHQAERSQQRRLPCVDRRNTRLELVGRRECERRRARAIARRPGYLPNGTPDPMRSPRAWRSSPSPSLRVSRYRRARSTRWHDRRRGIHHRRRGPRVSPSRPIRSPTGTLDPTFGDGGVVQTQNSEETVRTWQDVARRCGAHRDHRRHGHRSNHQRVRSQISPDGSLDAAYGSDGIVTFDSRRKNTTSTSLALRIGWCSWSWQALSKDDTGDLMLVALLDERRGLGLLSFGSGVGWVTTSEPGTQVGTGARGVAVQTDEHAS